MQQIQKDNTTVHDRYPNVFYVAKRYSDTRTAKARILSFGCSSGEEPFCLAKRYFPNASIVGVDASSEVLDIASRRNVYGDRVTFDLSTPALIEKNGPYDVIFAMSVLCRWPETKSIDDISSLYPFESFEEHVTILDKSLRLGGFLAIYNSNFSFIESDISDRYDILLSKHVRSNGFVKQFNRHNRVVKFDGASDCMYVKREDNNSILGLRRFLNEDGMVIGIVMANGKRCAPTLWI